MKCINKDCQSKATVGVYCQECWDELMTLLMKKVGGEGIARKVEEMRK